MVQRLEFPNYYVLQSLKIVFTLANSADPDENDAFYCGIFSGSSLFAKVPINSFKNTKV